MYNDSLYMVVASYEHYVQTKMAKGEKAVSLFKYMMGEF